MKNFLSIFITYRALFCRITLYNYRKYMAKEINHNPNKNHKKVYETQGQKVSPNGKWLTMNDGSRFRLKTLPSIATGQTSEQDTLLEELAEDDAVIRER